MVRSLLLVNKMKTIFKISIALFCIININYLGVCSAQNIKHIDNTDCISYTKISKNSKDIYVYDYEKIFTNEEKNILSEIIIKYKKQTKKEILVVTTHSIGDFSDIQEYAANLGSIYSNEIKNENVVTIAISKKLKEIGIATSPKARENLTDKINTDIINNVIIPKIKEGYFFEGIKLGIYEVIKKWNKE